MDKEKTNEGELTSTMGSFMSTNKEEKNDNSDSTPTSSTDAFTTTSKSQITAEDPISSTSSDLVESKKVVEKANDFGRSSNVASSAMKGSSIGDNNSSPIVPEKDMLDINITDTSTEKVTENVDDLVQDLENLLGEPTTSFDFNIMSKSVRKDAVSKSGSENVTIDLDVFSAELQALKDESTNLDETLKNSSDRQTSEIQDGDIGKTSSVENVPTSSSGAVSYSQTDLSTTTCTREDLKDTKFDNQTIDSLKTNVSDIISDKNEAEHEQSCQSEIVSASTSLASEVVEKADVTSSDSKHENEKELVVSSQNVTKYECERKENLDEIISTDSTLQEVEKEEKNQTIIEEQNDLISSEDVSASGKEEDSSEEKAQCTEAETVSENVSSLQGTDENQECLRNSKQARHDLEESSVEVEEKNKDSHDEILQIKDIEEPPCSSSSLVEPVDHESQQTIKSMDIDTIPAEDTVEEMKDLTLKESMDKDNVLIDRSNTVDIIEEKASEKTEIRGVQKMEENEESEVETVTESAVIEPPKEVDEAAVGQPFAKNQKSPTVQEKERIESHTDIPEKIEISSKNQEVTESFSNIEGQYSADEGVKNQKTNRDTQEVERTTESEPIEVESTSVDIIVPPQDSQKTLLEQKEENMDTVTTSEMSDIKQEQAEDNVISDNSKMEDKEKTQNEMKVDLTEDETKIIEEKHLEEQTLVAVTRDLSESHEEKDTKKVEIDRASSESMVEKEVTGHEEQSEEILSEAKTLQGLPQKKKDEVVSSETSNDDEKKQDVVADNQEQHIENNVVESSHTDTLSHQLNITAVDIVSPQVKTSFEVLQQEEIKDKQSDHREGEILHNLVDMESEKSETMSLSQNIDILPPAEEQISTASNIVTGNLIFEEKKEDEAKEEIDNVPKQVDYSLESQEVEQIELLKESEDQLRNENKTPIESSYLNSGIEAPLDIPTVDFIPDNLDIPGHSLSDDIDLLVQNTVAESVSSTPSLIEGTVSISSEMHLEMLSTVDSPKSVQESNISNTNVMLPLEGVPDLDVLSAISSLEDNKTSLTSGLTSTVSESDALLASSTLEESLKNDVPFESNIVTALPTVDEIFAEPSQQSQEDNLETLLAVASLQNDDYNMTTEEDFTSAVEQISQLDSNETAQISEEVFSSVRIDESPVVQATPICVEDVQQVNTEEENSVGQDEKESESQQKKEDKLTEPLMINIEDSEKERIYSPKITIKPIKPPEELQQQDGVSSASGDSESNKVSLKMTITKQSDNTHSILKIYNPDDQSVQDEPQSEPTVPKLIIKSIVQSNEQPQSPKTSTRNSKVFSPPTSEKQRSASPRITIKPIPKPEEPVAPLKITIKPLKSEETHKQKHSPKLTIRPIPKPEEEIVSEPKMHSPRVTIKPIVKPAEENEQLSSPRVTIKPIVKSLEENEQVTSPRVTIKPIVKPVEDTEQIQNPRVTIKPIVKPLEESEQVHSPRITIKPIVKPIETLSECAPTTPNTPRLTIKPVVKPSEKEKVSDLSDQGERASPKITIKPIVKPQEVQPSPPPAFEDSDDSVKERIVLKINKGTIPSGSRELRKEEEKLAKIKVKFSKEGGHPQIVQDASPTKRQIEQADFEKSNKRQKIETDHLPGITITPLAPSTHSKLKEMLSRNDIPSSGKVVTVDDDDDVTIVEDTTKKTTGIASPIVISEESNQDSMNPAVLDLRDPISEIPVFEITPDSVKTINPMSGASIAEVHVNTPPAPRRRGRPRKVPLQVREDFKDPKEEEPKPVVVESTRPKRSCRGQSVRTTLGIKPRKPRGPGRGRGSKRGMGTRGTPTPPESSPRGPKEPKLSDAKLTEFKEETFLLSESDKTEVKQIEIDNGLQKSPSNSLLAPRQGDTSTSDRADIVMYEEETRMSAETSSRAQTPAKQVVTTIPTVDLVEESQSSVQSIQSTATTESVKVRKGPRLEVHQEPDGAVISAEQLAEYYWQGGGPYMLQEQVAQFLGIKSFKRKYPNIPRRVVDMQERDFIRESGLAGEAMCDLGLTAVNSSDILDIMYSDFQDKYEEYCKHQRDRQAKDLTNKQRALSLAASQEKTKIDITQQAVQSAANWNANFNKTRREQRKACMDLQTLTVHYPKGKMKQINKPKIGYYPVALVPGQFTDYYREFTPTELNNLPLSTVLYDRIIRPHEMECDSQTDGSGSDSDSSSSDTDSSYSGSSDAEDCTICKPTPKRVAAAQ